MEKHEMDIRGQGLLEEVNIRGRISRRKHEIRY
jgi:hypothetical protein